MDLVINGQPRTFPELAAGDKFEIVHFVGGGIL
jgi:sulfur carrier protein ThiS